MIMAKYQIVGGTLSFGKIWESKDGKYLFRYAYYKGNRSLMRAKMPSWQGVEHGRK
jgi:hypothetical protein